MLPEAVIFDCDGLLVDTETCDYLAWRELHARYGVELTLEAYCDDAGLYGVWERMYAALSHRCGESPEALHAWREPRFRRLVEERLTPQPGLTGLLEMLHRREIRRGVASSSDSDWVDYLLRGLGLRDRFHAVATGHDVARRKPAPDLYLLAAERLGVAPAGCVALEDSRHGIEAARAAGMRVIAVPNPVSAYQDLSAAHARVPSLEAVDLDLLTRLLRETG